MALGALVNAACATRQVPPGPDPEYQRPEVVPWKGEAPEDPLTNIEAEGEWVDDAPAGTPAKPEPKPEAPPAPKATEDPGTDEQEPGPAPTSQPNPEPGPAPQAPQHP